jgi:alanine racemase
MVRLGIGLYGISNDPDEQPMLEKLGRSNRSFSQIRTIESGESVGYGRRFIASKTTKIATIPIGYADGISRHWGNGVGYVTINQQKLDCGKRLYGYAHGGYLPTFLVKKATRRSFSAKALL